MKGKRTAASEAEILNIALRLLLKPVVRFCVRRSVKLQQFLEVAKTVFVEVGQEEMGADKAKTSVSRLAVMTGVHRKDVARLLGEGMKQNAASDVFTRVLGQWRSAPGFSRRGAPRDLSLSGGSGEFAELVRSVSKELNPYTILFELERVGMVERKGDDVRLKAAEYVPAEDPESGLQLLSCDIDDLLRAAEANIFEGPAVAHLHLTTRYDNICPQYIPAIKEWFIREGARLHERARRHLSKYDKDINPRLRNKPGGGRVVLGSFSMAETIVKQDGEQTK